MQLGLLGIFDAGPFERPGGGVDTERVVQELAARAARVPTLRARILWPRPGRGRPLRVDDPAFQPLRHLRVVVPADPADLGTWAAGRATRPLEPDRPLWRGEVADLGDGRFAVLVVLSHLLADGPAGVAVLGRLLDVLPGPDPATPGAVTGPAGPVGWRPTAPRRSGLRDLGAAMRTFAGPEPATSLPRDIGPDRRLGVVRVPLPWLREVAHREGVTVNDLLLTAVAGGFRRLLAGRGEPVAGLTLRCTVPAAAGRPGRQVTGMLVVPLPVGEPPARCLALVHAETTEGKARLAAGGRDLAALHLPFPLARPLLRRLRRFGSRRITAAVADVVGPREPLELAGARLLEAVPIAPLAALVPLSLAALSYADVLVVSVNADAAIKDLGAFTDGMAASFTERLGRPLPGPPPTSRR